ncbi:MAG: MFS transporter [Chloroflexi bacterium]|nr:MFS transporter [Chloroflexota bacterium]
MRKLNARLIYLFIVGVTSLASLIAFTVTMIYQVTVVGLNPLQLVLIGTTLEVTALLFEIPTGVVADVYSRRLSVIIGMFVMGVGMAMQALPTFTLLVLAQVVNGIGWTFTSGATDAWLVDEIGDQYAGAVFLRASQVRNVCAMAGIALSVLLANISLALPIVISGAIFLALGMFLITTMPEHNFHNFKPSPREGRNSWQTMRHTFNDGVKLTRAQPVIVSLIGFDFLHGLFSEGYDRLWTAYVIATFTLPTLFGFTFVIWFGITAAASRLLSIAIAETIRRRFDLNQQAVSARLLWIINALLVVCLIAFPLVPDFYLALIAVMLIGALRYAIDPIHGNWLNQRITDSRMRATVLSMSSQMNAVGQIAGGPAIGVVGNSFSVRAALLISAVILLPVLPLISRAQQNKLPVISNQSAVIEIE